MNAKLDEMTLNTDLANNIWDSFEPLDKNVDAKIKYFEGAKKLEKIDKGDWIDVYANEDIVIKPFHHVLIHLGFAMELPTGYEAHIAPRSSTFKKWNIIFANHIGIIDESYCGNNDEWIISAYALPTGGFFSFFKKIHINKGDKIGQFRIMKKMPKIKFNEVEVLGNPDRNGFGSTGSK